MRLFFYSLVMCFGLSFLFAEEELKVHLTVQENLDPIYVLALEKKKCSFDQNYLNQLESVLLFDLKHIGFFDLIAKDPAKEKEYHEKGAQAFITKHKLAYLLQGKISQNELELYCLQSLNNQKVNLSKQKLTGNLSEDRVKIHKLAAAFLKQSLNKEAIFLSRLLYTVRVEAGRGKWVSEIWIADYDGANNRQVTFENSYCVHPLFLKGSQFLYVSYKTGQPKLYLSDFSYKGAKKEPTAMVKLKGNQLLPALSKDLKQLTFISDAAGRPDLFLQRLDKNFKAEGKPYQIYSWPNATQASSFFSPDGSKLVFVSDKSGTPRIYLLDFKDFTLGKRVKAKVLTIKNRNNVTPTWSSDNKKMAYSAKTEGVRQIWLYDFETKEEKQLTFDNKNKENPYFSLDNIHLVYNTEDKDEAELYLLNVNKGQPVKIGKGFGRKRFAIFE